MIAAAARSYRKLVAGGRLKFGVGSADATGQPDESVDAGYSVNTVYFWPDLMAAMVEIARVLKPGAVFVNALYTAETLGNLPHTAHGYRKYEPSELVRGAQQVGFAAAAVPLLDGKAFCVRAVK
jgi:SAM-dependent methyltransferase